MGPGDRTDCSLSYINISQRWSRSVGGEIVPGSLSLTDSNVRKQKHYETMKQGRMKDVEMRRKISVLEAKKQITKHFVVLL